MAQIFLAHTHHMYVLILPTAPLWEGAFPIVESILSIFIKVNADILVDESHKRGL